MLFAALLLSVPVFFRDSLTEQKAYFPNNSSSAQDSVPVSSQNIPAEVTVIMYHAVMEDSSRTNKYVITPARLGEDLAYLKACGYETVSVKQLYNYTQKAETLPEKSVLITFDDGYYNVYKYAFPLFKEYNMKFVFSIIGIMSEKASASGEAQSPAYSHTNYEQLSEMLNSGLVELGNHTYDLHGKNTRNGILPCYNESPTDYAAAVGGDIAKAQRLLEDKLNYSAYIFAYPLGAYNDEAGKLMDSFGFIATFSCEEGTNFIQRPEDLKLLKRYNRSGLYTSEEFFGRVLKEK